ncbi:MAG: hypothetical protein OXQ93_16430 [Gemmatimonadota bacterium]|nr:hypothetical protein [Gemmatimonadota bacterium]
MDTEPLTWPGWADVLPTLAAVLATLTALAGLVWTLGRIFRPWMRDAARAEADRVSAEVKALADKLATNDFPHVEARIEREADRMESRMESRMAEARKERREIADAVEAMRREVAALADRLPPPGPDGGPGTE